MPVHHHGLLLVKPATDYKIYICPDTLPAVSPVDEGDHPAVPGQGPRPHLPRVGEVVAGVGRGQAWHHYNISHRHCACAPPPMDPWEQQSFTHWPCTPSGSWLTAIRRSLVRILQQAWRQCGSQVVPQIDPSVPQPVVQSRRRPLLGPSPG